jgi:hypothetical protein
MRRQRIDKTTDSKSGRLRANFQEEIMTAVMYDDVDDLVTTAPAPPKLKLASAPTRSSKRASQPVGGGDPMVDAAARVLSIPLRHVYAVLWRVGVIDITG